MLRSMFSAISGLRSHQTMMDVTGNNIANVNTSGYKSTRATFQEALTQVTRGATTSGPAQGGTNPFQVGLGTQVAGIDQNFTQGSVQTTGRSTDLSINGEGLFIVGDQAATQQAYTRSGAFNFDANGFLVAAGGDYVLGWRATPPDPAATFLDTDPLTSVQIDLTQYTDPQIGSDGTITARDATGALFVVAKVAVARFVNTNGLQRDGNGLFSATPNSGVPQIGFPGEQGRGFLQAGTLEMSNVDLAAEFTNMIIAQRGFQANARTITASDEILQELVNLKR
jgi:flagellar hook protein FlgE